MAVALSAELDSPMRIGNETFAWLQAAVDAGMQEDDFTRLYPALKDIKPKSGRDTE